MLQTSLRCPRRVATGLRPAMSHAPDRLIAAGRVERGTVGGEGERTDPGAVSLERCQRCSGGGVSRLG